MRNLNSRDSKRRGFTLVELVIVVLVLGILAAVAAPRMVSVTDSARDNGAHQSLAVIRDAIELFYHQTGSYPGHATFTTDLEDMIQGDLPAPGVGANGDDNGIRSFDSTATWANGGTEGWAYDETTGVFRLNTDTAPYDTW